MKLRFEKIDDVFSFYKENKTEDEYFIELYGNKYPTNGNYLSLQENAIVENKSIKFQDGKTRVVVTKDVVDKFHPNNIDNRLFWEKAKTEFPLVSVNGGHSIDIDDCNNGTFVMAKAFGALDTVENYINNKFDTVNMLEIGYGHGNLFFQVKDWARLSYVGIDYYKLPHLSEFKNLKTIKKSGIPKKIKNNSLDIIYSINVLQHCSQRDRNDYFKSGFEKLKVGGIFVGSMFIETDQNKDDSCWGISDLSGRKYCGFFNQLTEADREDEFRETVESIGYEIIVFNNPYKNSCFFVLLKNQ